MLTADAKLPHLAVAWSERWAMDLFNREVLPVAYPDWQITELTVEKVAYEPGSKCVILYSLRFDHDPDSPPCWAAATFANGDGLAGAYSSLRPEAKHPSPLYLPEYQCLIEFFPMDSGLPSLAQVVDPAKIGPVLSRFWSDGDSRVSSCQPRVGIVRYYPQRRCVLRFEASQSPAQGVKADVIGKVYPPGPLARQVWQTMSVLQERAASVGVTTPRPLAIIDQWNLILMGRVPGTSLKKSLWKAISEIEGEQAVKLAAAALAALHSIPFEDRDVRTLETDLETLRLQAAPVHLIAPGLAGDVDAMLDQIAQSPIGAGSNAVSFLHGDFAPSQLLVDGERVGVVDFDKSCLGESAIDVGNFLAKLHRRAVVKGKDYYRGLARLFLDGYRELSPESVSEERARLFRALSLVRMAIHTFQRSPGSYARDREFSLPARLLREAAACLEGA